MGGNIATPPSAKNPGVPVDVDAEVGREGFTCRLKSGKEGLVRDLLLYKLTLEAQTRVAESRLSRRKIIRRLGTSETQFYRLLDQLLSLLHVLA